MNVPSTFRATAIVNRIPTLRHYVLLAFAPAVLWSGHAPAQMFKCAGEGNQPVYQDHPCPPGKELRDFTRDPAEVSVIPLSPPSVSSAHSATALSPKPNKVPNQKSARSVVGNPAERRFIHVGMNQGEVVARIGAPDLKSGGKRKLSRWTYMPAPGDLQTLTTIVFESGKVVDVERKLMR